MSSFRSTIIIALLFCASFLHTQGPRFSLQRNLIMIDPAGDARHVGRKLTQGYERGETLKFAESLQKRLSEDLQVQSILTRSPGEELLPFQTASFANRLNVSLFFSIHLYKEESAKPKVFLYQLAYNPLSDFAHRTFNQLDFIPLHQAHFKNIHVTKSLGNQIKSVLTNQHYQKQFDFYGPCALPLKPLVGITAPAFVLEIGVNKDNQWQTLIEPIIQSLKSVIKF